ncbi:MAG: TerD family protein [Lachnospiraceae bacterium]|nr:TerD family protein [Lachnospiraceae bacterium]
MIEIPMRSSPPLDCNSILHINTTRNNAQNPVQNNTAARRPGSIPAQNTKISTQNTGNVTQNPEHSLPAGGNHSASSVPNLKIPPLLHQIQKGQKVPLDPSGMVKQVQVCLGWNTVNPRCDLDVSAFILGSDGKALGDDWFVFYGQEYSPDKSVRFSLSSHTDREFISVDFNRLNPAAAKIVFVLTINDAFLHHLNFSMVKDAYIRILNAHTKQELVSFQMTDYYPNVISMMIGEIYLHQGTWKCNAVGNGVAKDLAGLCQLYGVETV